MCLNLIDGHPSERYRGFGVDWGIPERGKEQVGLCQKAAISYLCRKQRKRIDWVNILV